MAGVQGSLLATPFVPLRVSSVGERGLLGVTSRSRVCHQPVRLRLLHDALRPIHNRVSRFTADGDVALAGSEAVLDVDNAQRDESQRRRHSLRPRRQAVRRGRR